MGIVLEVRSDYGLTKVVWGDVFAGERCAECGGLVGQKIRERREIKDSIRL